MCSTDSATVVITIVIDTAPGAHTLSDGIDAMFAKQVALPLKTLKIVLPTDRSSAGPQPYLFNTVRWRGRPLESGLHTYII